MSTTFCNQAISPEYGKQLEQLLQQDTTLRQDIASSRPIRTKACCKGNNKIQRFALDTFPADLSWRYVQAKVPCYGTLVVFCCLPCGKIVIHAKRVGSIS